MKIKRVHVRNFKSFRELDLELGNLNVIIGANASGKSNFVQIFKFLRDIEQNDLRNAVSMNGGIGSLCNIQKCDEKLSIRFCCTDFFEVRSRKGTLNILETDAFFSLVSDSSATEGYRIEDNEYSQHIEIDNPRESQRQKEDWFCLPKEKKGILTFRSKKPYLEVNPESFKKALEEIRFFPPDELFEIISKRLVKDQMRLLFQDPLPFLPIRAGLFRNIGIYNFAPHLAKNPVPIAGRAELEEDGKNLALILHNIREGEEKDKLNNLLNSLLSFAVEADTEKFAEKSLMVSLREKYYQRPLRADMISDGTLEVMALLIALYFERKEIIILEEPEKNLHPHLVGGLAEMFKEVSKKKQIIVTTHSPQLVKYVGVENLLLVSRNEEGFSEITRPADKEGVQTFLKNEIGLDELFIQDLLTT